VSAVRLGITLPSFRDDPEPAIAVARAAESSGLDAVFAYDHLFRRAADGSRRPALELLAMLGAVAVETSRVALGSLVARATLRPPATLASGLDSVARIAGPGRLIATIGAGDGESREEMESFGFDFGDVTDRVEALRAAVETTRDRGYPVWVGGHDPPVREVAAAHADGWNRWGGSVSAFDAQASALRAAAARAPFTLSWGGLLLVGETARAVRAKRERWSPGRGVIVGGPEAVADALRAYADAGAELLVAGPIDSSDPDNAHLLGELVRPLL
jgi:alkanesulfonate monooxygenase SsuD/methylene tetrahydromethanopterin reductase-like flavin-dependent oxidoreductase (luciferase family)